MLQNQKMAALGRLVDGVSHEILDPLSFIWGNLTHLSRYCQQLLELVAAYEAVIELQAIDHPTVQHLSETIELDYLREDLPLTIHSIQSGAERLKQLASSLQNFCHIDEVYPKPADLHELIDGIILLLKSRLATRIQVNRNYAVLPPITCFAGHLSQVFMNILTNCIDALLAKAARHHLAADLGLPGTQTRLFDTAEAPTITITTQLCSPPQGTEAASDRWVAITISDNGPGLSPEAQQQVLNSFSIEQRLAKETDLATSYRIITAKHGGKFYVRSQTFSDNETAPGIGTEFEIRLPVYTATNSL
jgi:signal transduction histidine kinase